MIVWVDSSRMMLSGKTIPAGVPPASFNTESSVEPFRLARQEPVQCL